MVYYHMVHYPFCCFRKTIVSNFCRYIFVELKVPRLRRLPFETQIIERYKRREASVEEALIEMYLAGVSVRRVEDISEAL